MDFLLIPCFSSSIPSTDFFYFRAISGKPRRFSSGKPLSAGICPDGRPSFLPQEKASKKLLLVAVVEWL
jgi:hypothetical protein